MDIESYTLPTRPKGTYDSRFKTLEILTNYYSVALDKMEEIHIFSVKFDPPIPADNIQKRLGLLKESLPILSEFIQKPIITASNIYSLSSPVRK